MFFSGPLLALLLVQYTAVTQAAPTPTKVSPAYHTPPNLDTTLGDLVIPQEEASNDTAPTIDKTRSAPDFNTLLNEIGDFRLPTNITAGFVVKAAQDAVPNLSDADAVNIVNALRLTPPRLLHR
ncbi:hypothetical protein MMC28_000350 [Mycoblastus sanguinarius]|nr:hypothetical protein [Mycoblastus sanguinarius]